MEGERTGWRVLVFGSDLSLSETADFFPHGKKFSGRFNRPSPNRKCSEGDRMKTISLQKLLAFSLVFIFIIGPATAGVFDQLEGRIQEKTYSRESVKLSSFKSSSHYSLLEPKFTKYGLDELAEYIITPKSDIVTVNLFEKDLWQVLPATGPHCSSCGFNNATRSFGSIFMEEYEMPSAKFYFGGSGGGGAPGGGGCCG